MVVANKSGVHYAITALSSGARAPAEDGPADRQAQLRAWIERRIGEGVDFLQLREKTLDAGELFALATSAMELLRRSGSMRPQLLLNGRPDIAAAAGADGVHLTARPGELSPAQTRRVFHQAGSSRCLISVSCHTLEEVRAATAAGADLVLFGPVFEKQIAGQLIAPGRGLDPLRGACAATELPVLALGGVTAANAAACLQAGAAGVAGIRLFA